jgi:outer membrane protein OmpA-like peptidoglycan-associated protein
MRFLFGLLLLFSLAIQAQPPLSTKSKKAIEYYLQSDNFRVRGQLAQAIALLNQAIAKDNKFEEAYYRLGLTYRSSGELALSVKSFEKGASLTRDLVKEKSYSFILGETYLKQGQYALAIPYLDRFLALEKFDKAKLEQVKVWRSQCDYALLHQNEQWRYHTRPLSDTVNIFPMQYFPTLTADEGQLIFTVRFGKEHDDNEDIVVSLKAPNGRWGKPVSISTNVNSGFREGASTISADGRKLIFTICGPRGCDLYESNRLGEVWSRPISLGAGVNSAGWEAQPALSADGNELYFVSDRKGGIGGYDLWYSRKGEDGTWGKAINVGKPVNTPFDEIAPFIHVSNQNLYYASNGLPGFGSYDIYVSEKTLGHFPSHSEKVSAIGRTDEVWSTPRNMGAPLNDFQDQYSLAVTSDGQWAYYSKEEGRNRSKIYTTPIPKDFQVDRKGNLAAGFITDAVTQKPVKAVVELKDLSTNLVVTTVASDSTTGRYLVVVPGKSEYGLFVTAAKYLFASRHFDLRQIDQAQKPLELDFQLQPIVKNAAVVLNNIFFEVDKYQLEEKSKTELIEVVRLLKENPSLRVEIGGHTDDTGIDAYNQQLSLNRAGAVLSFLQSQGISAERVTKKGYGSQKPLKPNDSEENRQFNRRIEFKVL